MRNNFMPPNSHFDSGNSTQNQARTMQNWHKNSINSKPLQSQGAPSHPQIFEHSLFSKGRAGAAPIDVAAPRKPAHLQTAAITTPNNQRSKNRMIMDLGEAVASLDRDGQRNQPNVGSGAPHHSGTSQLLANQHMQPNEILSYEGGTAASGAATSGTKIIVNINGTTNINNFNNFSLSNQSNIKGRKIDMPQLRLGKEIEDNLKQLKKYQQDNMMQFDQQVLSQQQQQQLVQQQQQQFRLGGQSKSFHQKSGSQHIPPTSSKATKNARMTHKGLLQQTLKTSTNKQNEGMKQFLQQTLNMSANVGGGAQGQKSRGVANIQQQCFQQTAGLNQLQSQGMVNVNNPQKSIQSQNKMSSIPRKYKNEKTTANSSPFHHTFRQTQKLNLRERKSIGNKKQQQQQNLSSNNVTLDVGNLIQFHGQQQALQPQRPTTGIQSMPSKSSRQKNPTVTSQTNRYATEDKQVHLQQQRTMKSSRPLHAAKQQTLTRHSRNKSEVRKQQAPGSSTGGVGLGGARLGPGGGSVQKQGRKRGSIGKKMTIKTERGLNGGGVADRRKSVEQVTQPTSWMTSVTNAGQAALNNTAINNAQFMKADAEGMSMSSISSGDKMMDSSMITAGKNRHNLSIQQHLSKNYFLNSKQLLRHLSPARLNQQLNVSLNQGQANVPGEPQLEMQSSMDAKRAPPNSQCTFQKKSLSMGMGSKQTKQRNRSTSNAAAKRGQANQTANHSNSRKAQSLSNSRESGQNVFQGPAVPVIRDRKQFNHLEPKDQKIDRIIRQNIKKNRNKQNEESLKRQEADLQQKRRKEELSQLNQHVRKKNASKIVNQLEKRIHEGAIPLQRHQESDYGSALQPPCTLSGGNNSTKRRSQSAIEGINLSGGRKRTTSSGDKRIHHSQSNRAGSKSKPSENQKTSPQQQSRYLPHTTKAEFQGKPRSFVEEINQLTHQIEREIGKQSLKLDLSNHRPSQNQKKSPNHLYNDNSVNIQIKNIQGATQVLSQQKVVAAENILQKKIKRQQKRHSLQVHKFMEKKKRQHQMKKSMELTIEVGKQLQIKQNLFKLDNYVKKHNRILSQQQATGDKKSQGPVKRTKKHSKHVIQQNDIVDITNVLPHESRNLDQRDGMVLYDDDSIEQQRDVETINISRELQPNNSIIVTGHARQPTTKQTVFMKHKSKSIGSVQQNTLIHRQRYDSSKERRTPEKSVNPTILSPPQQPLLADNFIAEHQQKKKAYKDLKKQQKQQQTATKSLYETEKIADKKIFLGPTPPNPQQMQMMSKTQNQQQQLQLYQQQQLQLKNQLSVQSQRKSKSGEKDKQPSGQVGSAKLAPKHNDEVNKSQQLTDKQPYKKYESEKRKQTSKQAGTLQVQTDTDCVPFDSSPIGGDQVSPKSVEQIRRIHELVALYRCRFRPNASDAAVMGTLHSAASVIQIHFRYLKHLKEVPNQNNSKNISKKNRKEEKNAKKEKQQKVQTAKSTANRLDGGVDFVNQLRKKELPDQQIQIPSQNEQIQSAKRDKKQHQSRQTDQSSNTLSDFRKLSNTQQKSETAVNKSEIIESSSKNILKKRSVTAIDDNQNPSQQASKRGNTPMIVPGLNFDKLNAELEESNKKRMDASMHKNNKESPKAPLTASSYSSIFNKLGLPIPRSARIKVDYEIVKKDPNISAQLKEIIKFKEAIGKQVIEEGKKLSLITERRCQQNKLRLERWVSASYKKVDHYSHERHANSAKKRYQHMTEDELINYTQDNRQRLVQKLNSMDTQSCNPSARIQSGRISNHNSAHNGNGNAPGNNATIADDLIVQNPYMNKQLTISGSLHAINDKPIGSSRQEKSKIVELINSSRTSNKKKERSSDSQDNNNNVLVAAGTSSKNGGIQKLQDIHINFLESGSKNNNNANLDSQRIKNLMQFRDTKEPSDNQFSGVPESTIQKNDDRKDDRFGQEMVIINQAANVTAGSAHLGSTDSQANNDNLSGPDADSTSNQLNRTESLNQIFNKQQNEISEIQNQKPQHPDQINLKKNLNEDSEKNVNLQDLSNSNKSEDEGQGGINEIVDNLNQLVQDDMGNTGLSEVQNQPFQAQEIIVSDTNMWQSSADQEFIKDSDPPSNNVTVKKHLVSQVTSLNNSEMKDSMNNSRMEPQQPLPPTVHQLQENQYYQNEHEQPQGYVVNESQETQETQAQSTQKASQHVHMAIKSSTQSVTNSQITSILPSNQTSPKLKQDNIYNTNSPASEPDINSQVQNATSQNIELQNSPRSLIKFQNQLKPNPQSPQSETQSLQIHAHAVSISSTNSEQRGGDLTHPKNLTPNLESPPNIAGESMTTQGLLTVIDMEEKQMQQLMEDERKQQTEDITDKLLNEILEEVIVDFPNMVARPNLNRVQNHGVMLQHFKFFEKKGIKTDLFAIEKYVEEVLLEVLHNKDEFMEEIKRPLGKTPLDQLFQMQNDEIGNFEHFHQEQKPVLALDLYLRIEKRRKDSKDQADDSRPDGLFDFDEVTDQELAEDRVDRNFLSECVHIHNKVLFDCINDSLQQFRPHGKEGPPMQWSRQGRKLKPIEDFTLEEMFEITKHDLFRMAIMQAGTLPRKEFVFGGQFDEELFSEIREKKLATLLVREIVETEPQWLKWDFEETQTKVDLADMVLESLMTETIDFLNQKHTQLSQSQ